MDQDIRRVACLHKRAVILRQAFQSWIGRFDEDLGLESRLPEDPLDSEHLVSDSIAIAKGGEDLMNFAAQFNTGPEGSSATTSDAGRRLRRRLRKNPGSVSGSRSRAAWTPDEDVFSVSC